MIVVIVAGGSGTRLWPLSTPEYPKHLLRIADDPKSLLQHAYDRAKALTDDIYVVPEASHAHHVRLQLPDLGEDSFIIEPARRGTANCLVGTLAYLESRHDNDEPVVFIAADHYIRDLRGFVHTFKVAGDVARRENRLVLVGVEPQYPATGFGYIQKDGLFDEDNFVFNVDSFHEKPDHETAQKYVASGDYLWNCSYFMGSVNTFKKSMERHAPALFEGYEKLLSSKTPKQWKENYLTLQYDAIDYALMERADDLLVVPATFDWMDLGSYLDLHKAVGGDKQGNHTLGKQIELDGVENSLIQNHEDKPLAVIGLDNIVVVNTPEGILVTRKDLAQNVGKVSKRFSKK